ncbi:MAG: ABC transporter permease [Ktedonobacteraceae bacterium]
MAAPILQRRTSASTLLITQLRKIGNSIGRPLFAVVLALIAGSIVIILTSPGSLPERFNAVVTAFQDLYQGSFGNPQTFSATLVRVSPLILTGLSVAIAFRAGLFNIGAEGQLAMGAMTAAIISFTLSGLPGWLLVPLMIIGSMLVGAVWGGIVGILKAWRGAHEVVTTIMLNWIAFYFTDYLITGPFKDPKQANVTPTIPTNGIIPSVAVFYNQTLGTFLPKIATPDAYLVDMGIFISLLALVVYWFITSRTAFGYEVRVIGQNPKAARYAGIPIKRNLFAVMALAGAFSGLAGALNVMGQFPYHLISSTFSIDSTGFDAIGVALLGRTTAIGVFFGSLLFGGLRQGGTFMQADAGIPGDLVYIIQALVLFSIAAEFLPTLQRSLPSWARLSRRPAIVPSITGSTMAASALVESGSTGGNTSETSAPQGSSVAVIERTEEVHDALSDYRARPLRKSEEEK